jgi:cytochrome c oxidase subunit 4
MMDPGFAPAGPETRAEHPHPGDYSSHNDQDTHGNHGGLAQYLYVFAALCVLTLCSIFTTSSLWPFHSQPHVGWAFMMAVSCTKAMLVILFFMHVKYEANWKYVLTIPAGFMSIFLILMLVPDVGLRSHWASEERELYMPEPRQAASERELPAKPVDEKHVKTGHST